MVFMQERFVLFSLRDNPDSMYPHTEVGNAFNAMRELDVSSNEFFYENIVEHDRDLKDLLRKLNDFDDPSMVRSIITSDILASYCWLGQVPSVGSEAIDAARNLHILLGKVSCYFEGVTPS